MRQRTKYMMFFFTYILINVLVVNYLFRKKIVKVTSSNKQPDLKYILQWTSPLNSPFIFMGQGQQGYIQRNCTFINCFITGNRSYLDLEEFDAVAFDVSEIPEVDIPRQRSEKQKYIFVGLESSHRYPVCDEVFDDFFNMTWTYRLDSDVRFGYLVVRDDKGKIIGPNIDMHWMNVDDMLPVSNSLKEELKTKTKAAVWFVSNCKTRNHREVFVGELKNELRKYNLSVDIVGDCGELRCPFNNDDACHQMIKDNYYFYLAFENSFSVDYVTEKVLHGLQYNAVPIVYGGANYTRFMPDGIYLNARELGAKKLAKKMQNLINNREKYLNYFKWKKHYSFHIRMESFETNEYCNLCAALNDHDFMNRKTTYRNLRRWWNNPGRCENENELYNRNEN